MIGSFVLILFAVLNFTLIQTESALEGEDFDVYLTILKHLPFVSCKLRLLQSVWGEIRADYPADLNKTIGLYQQVSNLIAVDANETRAYELQEELREYLLTKTAKILQKKWNSDISTPAHLQFYSFLCNSYDLVMLKNIYLRAIDELFDYKDIRVLAAHVHSIYHKDNHNKNAYELMVHSQLHLLQKFRQNEDVYDFYLFNVAYYLLLSKNDVYYNQLDKKEKAHLQTAMSKLPKALRNLFYETEFCLSQKNKYLYTAYMDFNIDSRHRYVFIWNTPNTVGAQGAYVSNFTEKPEKEFGEVNLQVSLRSKQFNIFLYLEPSVHNYQDILTAWLPGNAPENTKWSVHFVDGKLVFHQHGKYLCSSEKFYDETRERIFVQGYADAEHSPQSYVCQWDAGSCPP